MADVGRTGAAEQEDGEADSGQFTQDDEPVGMPGGQSAERGRGRRGDGGSRQDVLKEPRPVQVRREPAMDTPSP